jgi:argininosuccinate lyase
MEKEKKLWGGRFKEAISDVCRDISESISFDRVLYEQDIKASLAHVSMLARQKIIPVEIADKIKIGLRKITEEIENGEMEFLPELEDIHMHIEKRLIEIVGDDGKFFHTGRSRNDQVAVDTHLFLKENITAQKKDLKRLLSTILALAEKHKTDLWAGYTHTQIAQPVLLGHYLMAYFWMFHRDLNLLDFALDETDTSPLGAAALGGANYPIDREFTASELGFTKIYQNSMDAVSNRDYQMSYHFFATRLFIHISRFCEDIILYNTVEFSYVKLGDRVTTGSSIMPQKKNPDIAELLRGKSARVIGNLQSLLVNLKGLPLTYNRDLQEDKVYLFDTIKQVALGIGGVIEVLNNVTFYPDRVVKNLRRGFAQATDVADYLVSNYKIPFRKAHEMTGQLVLFCENKMITLDEVAKDDIAGVWGDELKNVEFSGDLLKLESCIARKQGTGSTSYQELEKQIEAAKKLI